MAGIFRYNATNSSTPIRRHTLSPFCTSPGQLQDVTMDNSYAIGYRSPCYAGSTSPGQGRSVREFEEQMAALRKENFNLKLRIYFLEEKIPGYSSANNNQDGHDTLLKQNVDLKVDIEVLRKELQEKQTLLCEAAKAMDLMEKQQKQTEEQSQAIIDELNEKIRYIESENKELEKSPTGQHTLDQLMGRTELGSDIDTVQKIRELEGFVKQYELKTDELTEKINELETTINEKNDTITNLETKIKEIEYQNSELQEQLEFKQQEVTNAEHQKLKDELIEYKKQLADKICTLEEVETKLQQKTKDHEKACNAIQKLLINTKDLQSEIEKLRRTDLSQSVLSQLKEDTQSVDASCLKRTLNDTTAATAEWTALKNKFEKLIEEKDGDIRKLKLEVKKKTANLQNLVNKELWEKNREIERLTMLLNKTQSQAASMPSSPTREVDQLQQSFTDSDYSTALERNKTLQKKVDSLIQRLCTLAEHNPEPLVQQLRIELQEAHDDAEKAHRWRKECADVCEILKDRLEELAGFLDSLLEDDVIGALAADKRRAMRKAVNRSLEMSRSLTNMSLSRSRLSIGDPGEHSLIQLSTISCLLDFTTENKENRTQNSHVEDDKQGLVMIENLKSEIKALKKELDRRKSVDSTKKDRKSLPMNLIENQSESEAWSEPDRKVSLARIGLEEPILMKSNVSNVKEDNRETTTESESDLTRKSKWCKAQKKISVLEQMIAERDNRILEVQCELVDADNRLKEDSLRMIEITRELQEYKKVNEMLEIEIARFKTEDNGQYDLRFNYEAMKRQLLDKENLLEKLQKERDNLNIEIRLTEMKMETLKTDIENLKLKHEKQLEATIEDEQQKLGKLQAELIAQYEEKLKQQEDKFQNNLARDWVSKSLYNDMKYELETAQKRFSEAQNTIEFLQENEAELNAQLIENEKCVRSLRKNLDDATLQASKAALERTKAMNDKLQLEAKVNELTVKLEKIEQEKLELVVKLTKAEKSNALLHIKLTNHSEENGGVNTKTRKQSSNGSEASGYTSEEVPMTVTDLSSKGRRVGAQRHNNSSPDLGIESDAGRTSGAELASMQAVGLLKNAEITSGEEEEEKCDWQGEKKNKNDNGVDAANNNSMTVTTTTAATNTSITTATTTIKHDCVKVDQENEELRRKLRHTKRALEDTWNKLRSANQRKEQIERDLRRQIEKTQKVLENARTNLESELKPKKK